MRGKDVRPSLACERLEARDTPSAGSLDASFGSSGKLLDANLTGTARAVTIQADGAIVAAGFTKDATGKNVATVARYLADGKADTAFNAAGTRSVSFGSRAGRFAAVTQQRDGKLVLAGDDGVLSRVVRLNSDGTLDASFDTDGMVQSSLSMSGGTFTAADVVVNADGKVIVAGTFTPNTNGVSQVALTRYNADGSLDTTFGKNGVTLTTAVSGGLFATAMTLQADGKILVAGTQNNGGTNSFALERYTADGKLDTTFSSDGRVQTPTKLGTGAVDVRVLAGGGIVAVGGNFDVVRYKADGSVETSFGSAGTARLNPGGSSQSFALAVQTDGNIVVAGKTNQGTNPDNAILVRYLVNGTADQSFGDRGKLVTDMGGSEQLAALAVQTDGKIVAVGSATPEEESAKFLVARYNPGYARTATTTTLTAASATSTYGQAVTLSAKVTVTGDKKPTGAVFFKIGDVVLGSVIPNAKGEAVLKTIALPAGTTKVVAYYNGSAVQASSTSEPATVVVAKAQVAVVTATLPTSAIYGQAVGIAARVTVKNSLGAKVGGSVAFFDNGVYLGTATLDAKGQAQFLTSNLLPGTHVFSALFNGNVNTIAAMSNKATLVVSRAATFTALAVTGDLSFSGQALTLAAQVRPQALSTLSPSGTVTFRDGSTIIGRATVDASGRAVLALSRGLARGTHSLTATYAGNGGFLALTSPAGTISLTI